jgi:hypothetical protein
MFGLTDTDFQVLAIRHKEKVARGDARARLAQAITSDAESQQPRSTSRNSRWARIAALIRTPIRSLPASS